VLECRPCRVDCSIPYLVLNSKEAGRRRVVPGDKDCIHQDVSNTIVNSESGFIPRVEGKEHGVLWKEVQKPSKMFSNQSRTKGSNACVMEKKTCGKLKEYFVRGAVGQISRDEGLRERSASVKS
jgi:hypothetical protein